MSQTKQHSERRIHKTDTVFYKFEEYLSEFVYGGIDGCVTTFAVIAGAVGAGLDSTVIIVLGFANLFADGFAMSIGAFLSAKSENDNYNKHKQIERWEIEHIPEAEKKEIRDIYRQKGFSGGLLDQVVDTITSNKEVWVSVMMKEELNMIEQKKSPLKIGLMTYFSFILIGMIPLSTYAWDYFNPMSSDLFLVSSVFTASGFFIIGVLKSYINQTGILKGVFETLALGMIAAFVSYYVGHVLEFMITNQS